MTWLDPVNVTPDGLDAAAANRFPPRKTSLPPLRRGRKTAARLAVRKQIEPSQRYRAAVTMISTLYWGAASLASTVARAGVLPADIQPSHAAFISAKVFMSVR